MNNFMPTNLSTRMKRTNSLTDTKIQSPSKKTFKNWYSYQSTKVSGTLVNFPNKENKQPKWAFLPNSTKYLMTKLGQLYVKFSKTQVRTLYNLFYKAIIILTPKILQNKYIIRKRPILLIGMDTKIFIKTFANIIQ